MKRRDPQRIGDIIELVVAQSGLTETMAAQRACYLWPEVVGPAINRYTSRRYVDGSVLHVFITSAALRNELSFMRAKIISSLNSIVGSDVITDLIIH